MKLKIKENKQKRRKPHETHVRRTQLNLNIHDEFIVISKKQKRERLSYIVNKGNSSIPLFKGH